jgi:hypothetical protein
MGACSRPKPHTLRSRTSSTRSCASLTRSCSRHLDRLVEQLVAVEDVEYSGLQILTDLARADFDRWMTVWRRRLERERDADARSRYQAVPFHDHNIDLLAEVAPDERRAVLTQPLSLAGPLDSWRARQLGRLFWRAGVHGFDDVADEPSDLVAERVTETLDAFTEWALSDKTNASAVLETLFELPWQLVLDQPA